jgi:hypothetical protein
VFERLLTHHPNRDFVNSVLLGLREGFWPWADTNKEGYPLTHDESRPLHLDHERDTFLKSQLEHEQKLERISMSFKTELLPGMYCMPNYVVPKPHSTDWRLVNDLSAGRYSLNSMVDRHFVTGYLYRISVNFYCVRGKRNQVSDLDLSHGNLIYRRLYRMCPMHKTWQLKQVIRVGDKLYVDRVNVFGGSASPAIFISVNSLTAWIAVFELSIEDLIYVDSFGVEEEGELTHYAPYAIDYPSVFSNYGTNSAFPTNRRSKSLVIRLSYSALRLMWSNSSTRCPKSLRRA